MADSDKTEEATQHRLDEARSKGDVPKSKEFVNFLILFGASLAVYFAANHTLHQFIALFHKYFDFKTIKLESVKDFMALGSGVITEILFLLTPLFVGIFFFGVGAHLGQFGLLFTTENLSPDFEKLDPIQGIKRFFSLDVLMELVKSTLKMVVISAAFYMVLKGETEHLIQLGAQPLPQIFLYFIQLIAQMFFVLLIFMFVLGVGDFFYTRWSYAKKHRMSFQEVKEEHKNREGDPLIRSRIRQMQREKARQRMMEKVPQADVVVTNPTHVAVALQYKKGLMRAPVVVAKGAGYIAVKIKIMAAEAGVPILERKQLARFLFRNVEVNDVIPESLYTAVAEILAYVYKMKTRFSQWKENHA
jgi:flagellar biosynthetic protein FlhB